MNKIFTSSAAVIILSVILFAGCQSNNNDAIVNYKQVNLTILIDLSDRISAAIHPQQAEKDIACIVSMLEGVKKSIEGKGAIYAKDKIRVIFYPNHENAEIRKISEQLQIDFGKLQIPERKATYDSLVLVFKRELAKLYNIASQSKKFNGSDLYTFFKYRISDNCIDPDSNSINTLLVLTDGYMYHENAMFNNSNRYSYILPTSQHVQIFRNSQNWKDAFASGNYGFLPTGQNLSHLNILIAELEPVEQHPDDYEIIEGYWSKWLEEMGMQKSSFKILRTDLPSITEQVVKKYVVNTISEKKLNY